MVNFPMTNQVFLRLRSKVTCFLKSTDDWHNGLDLVKAFDTANHEIILKKRYGVQRRELSRFQSYRTNREKLYRVNGVDSETGDTEVGAPQGSCLLLLLLSSISGLQCMHCSPHAMLQIVSETSFHLSLSSAIFRNMIKSSVVLNCFTSRSCLLFASTMS